MSHEMILQRVIALFSAMVEDTKITADSEIMEDLEISSMDVLFLITNLEEEFHVKVPEREIRRMFTVGDVAKVIEELLA
jgi:acyl carrier protein